MKKFIISTAIILIVIISCISVLAAPTITSTQDIYEKVDNSAKPNIKVIEPTVIHFYDTNNKEMLLSYMQKNDDNMNAAHTMAEMARFLGKHEDNSIIQEAQRIWWENNDQKEIYLNKYKDVVDQENANYIQQYYEYPVATAVWLFLKDKGYNDYVCAGILGNMMAETGGQTLNLIVDEASVSGYYGLCQWSTYYNPTIYGKNLEDQLDYLINSMVNEFNYAGFCYATNFDYFDFLDLTDEQEAAYAFAKCYERCTPQSYNQRKMNATVALNYFTK